MLYHFNFGFPLLSSNSRITGPVVETVARDDEAKKDRGVEEWFSFPKPIAGYKEKVFFHNLAADSEGNTFISLYNPDTGDGSPLGIVLRFNKKEVPSFTQWKMPRKGFYVTGLEPGTAAPLGRGVLREKHELPLIEGQAQYEIGIDFSVISSQMEIEELQKEAKRLQETIQ